MYAESLYRQCLNNQLRLNTADNGQNLKTVYPVPGNCVWITKATFDPEDVPARLMEDDLTVSENNERSLVHILSFK